MITVISTSRYLLIRDNGNSNAVHLTTNPTRLALLVKERGLPGSQGDTGPMGEFPTGFMAMWPVSVPCEGWLLCDGTELLIANEPALFAVLGTAWGGDGITKFRLPNLCGRTPVGSGTGVGPTARTVGQTGGEESVTLTEPEMPSHTHIMQASENSESFTSIGSYMGTDGSQAAAPFAASTNGTMASDALLPTGEGNPHNNMQPYAVVAIIIKR